MMHPPGLVTAGPADRICSGERNEAGGGRESSSRIAYSVGPNSMDDRRKDDGRWELVYIHDSGMPTMGRREGLLERFAVGLRTRRIRARSASE